MLLTKEVRLSDEIVQTKTEINLVTLKITQQRLLQFATKQLLDVANALPMSILKIEEVKLARASLFAHVIARPLL